MVIFHSYVSLPEGKKNISSFSIPRDEHSENPEQTTSIKIGLSPHEAIINHLQDGAPQL